ncbi:UV DNA damage repair endonuclease UvsE [Belnapia sp. T18]|uniref:UV DNA damage repair endonuclease UvsE n=1 Tax=Belnapia arida TaxID=2804533 RepID=A0ABS1UAV9_9PROT|nr:UV DNA damage repair endonuclease UvsE [Belnapia arida]MBL6081823.1 UV DNA damage repair endonuclease UvsE [Belnapia arida]
MSRRQRKALPSATELISAPLRLGVPVKLMGAPDIKSNDTRRWQQSPHLRVSLEYMDQALSYLDRHDIRMYRLSSDLAPYATHPDMPQFHSMVRDSDAELRAFGAKAKSLGIRLSFHPSQFVVLNSPDPALVDKSISDLNSQAEMLDRMELGPEAVMVIHVGGTYGDRAAANARWVETWNSKLSTHVKRRLVLEHDDLRFSASDVLWIHEQTGVRLIFDHQHFWCLNPDGLDMRDALKKILRTWPDGQRPKVHFSSPRTEMRELKRKEKGTRKVKTVLVSPVNTGHADFCNPFEFATFMRVAEGLDFDVMLEAKVKDLALIRLRLDLLRYAPDVAQRFGLAAAEEATLQVEEQQMLADSEKLDTEAN